MHQAEEKYLDLFPSGWQHMATQNPHIHFLSFEENSGSLLPLLPSQGRVERVPEKWISLKTVALIMSVLLNLALWLPQQQLLQLTNPPHWPTAAVQAAEAAALHWCSGHGIVFVDTMAVDGAGTPVCECHDCFTGPDCALRIPACVADANSGDPLLFEAYWRQNAELGTVVIPGWYRMSYQTGESGRTLYTEALEASIRALHALVGNAVTEGRYVVVGTGSLQLINAAVSSLALDSSATVSNVVSRPPFYGAYHSQTEFFATPHYRWAGDSKQFPPIPKGEAVIELIASPNNPDASIQEVAWNGTASIIYDHAYYWPHLTAMTKPVDQDIMLFTLSKVTGHAGSRVGWAIVKDPSIYLRMMEYVQYNTLGVSHDSQLRATQLLNTVLKTYSKHPVSQQQGLFHFGKEVLQARWARLQSIFNVSSRFTLQRLEPQYCSFFGKLSAPSPGYAWVHCEWEEDGDCLAVMSAAGIIGRAGNAFGTDDRYVRLSLLKRQSDFDNLADHLVALIAEG